MFCDESEEDDGEHGRKGMGLSLFGAWISDFFETSDEVDEGCDFEHVDLREWKKGETISPLSITTGKTEKCWEKSGTKTKKTQNTCWRTAFVHGCKSQNGTQRNDGAHGQFLTADQ